MVKGKIVLLAKLTPYSGNLTTARRIRSYLLESDYICELKNTASFDKAQDFVNHLLENKFNCVICVHLWRAGRLLLVIFGGTDLNVDTYNWNRLKVMTRVVKKARLLVAFSQVMAKRAEEVWPDIKTKLFIQPQAVMTYPLHNFEDEDEMDRVLLEISENDKELFYPMKNKIIFTLVAGLRPVKDPMFLFNSFSCWHCEDSRIHLVVIGPEIDLEFSKTVKDEAKRYPGVVVLPPVSQPRLYAFLKNYTVALVNSSLSEGMASSIIEAMYLEITVIARKIAGNESLIKHEENGLLFETTQEFLSLAKRVAYDDEYRDKIKKGGKKYIVNNHCQMIEGKTYKSVVKTMLE
ncbi:glycosyltransferase 1 domain-containing protein 1-like isoform X2 [Xenia sp. Carnegie-2017]|uniref:glycosyltransferase 1 domain-containing protein 1-like isoform X2 n=1 Tax=Xenia sp. Carnegie-2017 TaxID=2897299 RepID=UPI001F03D25E|nr:glycosyltransferase 1 domain-containing protein 1-like isoform X2 [Xenia sp. Carnegie-2017]